MLSAYQKVAFGLEFMQVVWVVAFALAILYFLFKRHSIKEKLKEESDKELIDKLNRKLSDLNIIPIVLGLIIVGSIFFSVFVHNFMPSQRHYVNEYRVVNEIETNEIIDK